MFYDNLKAICKEKGVKITPIVLECGGTKGVIGGWKKGATPNSDIVMKLSVRLNVPTDRLLFGSLNSTQPPQLSDDETELILCYKQLSADNKIRVMERALTLAELEAPAESPTLDSRTIPYSVLKVSAGSGEYLDAAQMEPIRIVSNDRTADADFAVKITGDSMEPQYSDGDIVLVKSQPAVELGQIGIFIIDGHGYIKKLGERELISLNPDYANIPLHEYQETECKGLVLGILEPSDILSCFTNCIKNKA